MPNGVGVARLPARSHWRQSQEHCCPGSQHRAAAAEDGGALASLCEVFLHACTSAGPPTWETARAQTRGVEFTGFLRKAPTTLRGHPLKPQTRPFSSEAAWSYYSMSYLPDIPPNSKICAEEPVKRKNEAINSPTRRCSNGCRMQPKL